MSELKCRASASSASLELNGVHAGYGDFAALFGVGLHVDPGEAVVREVAALAGLDPAAMPVGIDGCGVPTLALTLASAFVTA